MEGTWQWEQRKHCHIILLNPLSYVKENPEQAAGEPFYISRFFARPSLLTDISQLNSLEGEKDDSQKNPVLAARTIMSFYIFRTPNVVPRLTFRERLKRDPLVPLSNYRTNTNIRHLFFSKKSSFLPLDLFSCSHERKRLQGSLCKEEDTLKKRSRVPGL
ncbi:hypothetical protein ANTQUA_LOCUS409 [Anthophora quadrimaculata]